MLSCNRVKLLRKHLDIPSWKFIGEGNQHFLIECINTSLDLFGYLLRFNKNQSHSPLTGPTINSTPIIPTTIPSTSNDISLNDPLFERQNPSNHDNEASKLFLQSLLQKKIANDLYNSIPNLSNLILTSTRIDTSELSETEIDEFMQGIEASTHDLRTESRRSKPLDRKGTLEIVRNFQRDFCKDTYNPKQKEEQEQEMFSGLVEIKPKSHLEERYTESQIEAILQQFPENIRIELLNKYQLTFNKHEKCRYFKIQLNKLVSDHSKKSSEEGVQNNATHVSQLLSLYQPINFFDQQISEEIEHLLLTPSNNLKVTSFKGKREDIVRSLVVVSELPIAVRMIRRMIEVFDGNTVHLSDAVEYFLLNAQVYLKEQMILDSVVSEIVKEITNEQIDLSLTLLDDFKSFSNLFSNSNESSKNKDVSMKILFGACKLFLKFLISVTFRDLSILVNVHSDFSCKNHISSEVAIIDCDLKPFSTYQKYINIENTNLLVYFQYLQHNRSLEALLQDSNS